MTHIAFAPVIPSAALIALALLAAAITLYGLHMRARGAWGTTRFARGTHGPDSFDFARPRRAGT